MWHAFEQKADANLDKWAPKREDKKRQRRRLTHKYIKGTRNPLTVNLPRLAHLRNYKDSSGRCSEKKIPGCTGTVDRFLEKKSSKQIESMDAVQLRKV